jgi:N-acetylglucosaminyldiphosphoundecaprenol N-acetyl-beta-D-mannosaminyltransferase
VFVGSADEVVAACVDKLQNRVGGRIATANLDFLAIARRDAGACELLERSSLVVADGAPVAWLASFKSRRRIERVAGVDLVGRLLEFKGRSLRVVMYGGEEGISRQAASVLRARHPHIAVTERISPPFRELTSGERESDRERIRASNPDLVLVALGFPRQERLIADYYDCAPDALWLGIGGTFDFLAGRRARAPKALQRLGLEWTVRLVQEPGRLWRRYLLQDIPEAARLTAECVVARVRS